jgi:hypothetical protein
MLEFPATYVSKFHDAFKTSETEEKGKIVLRIKVTCIN